MDRAGPSRSHYPYRPRLDLSPDYETPSASKILYDYNPIPPLKTIAKNSFLIKLQDFIHGDDAKEDNTSVTKATLAKSVAKFGLKAIPSTIDLEQWTREFNFLLKHLRMWLQKRNFHCKFIYRKDIAWSPYGVINDEETFDRIEPLLSQQEAFKYACIICYDYYILSNAEEFLHLCYKKKLSKNKPIVNYWITVCFRENPRLEMAYQDENFSLHKYKIYNFTAHYEMFLLQGPVPCTRYFWNLIANAKKDPFNNYLYESTNFIDADEQCFLFVFSKLTKQQQEYLTRFNRSIDTVISRLLHRYAFQQSYVLIMENFFSWNFIPFDYFPKTLTAILNCEKDKPLFGYRNVAFCDFWDMAPVYYTRRPACQIFVKKVLALFLNKRVSDISSESILRECLNEFRFTKPVAKKVIYYVPS